MSQLTPVVKWLLILNLGIFFTDFLALDWWITNRFAFKIHTALFEYRVWEFLTFQFLHGSVGHVLFNSIGLFFFGPWMERWWGSKQFLFFYLACGAAGAIFYSSLMFAGILPQTFVATIAGSQHVVSSMYLPLVGASAGIYGILVGVAVIAPSLRVTLLFPPVTLTMRQLAIAALAIAVLVIITGIGGNEGGEAGHLGGAIMGYFMMKTHGWMNWIRNAAHRPKGRPASDFTPKIRPRTSLDLHSSTEVDRILEKISRDGFHSLTEAEKELLQQAAKRGEM